MRILLATGGSGGHIFPALQVAEELSRMGHEVVFVGKFGVGLKQIEHKRYPSIFLSAKGLACWPPQRCIESIVCMAKAILESFRALKEIRPAAVCGFGGYAGFAVVLTAALLRYPTMIHEQNVIPGRANKFLSKFVRKIAITFRETSQYLNSPKTVLTGCPCHAQITPSTKEQLCARFQLDLHKITILVLGGSQGSHRINSEFMKTARLLQSHLDFQVIHLCGKNDYSFLKNQYQETGIRFRLFDFLDDPGTAYQMADMVISRAGAVTVLETVKFRVPAILIPYPFAGGHQRQNAEILCQKNAARMIEEKDLTAKILERNIVELLTQRPSKEELKRNVESLVIADAAHRIAQEIVQLKQRSLT